MKRAQPTLVIAGVLLLAAVATFVYLRLGAARAREAALVQLLADVTAEVDKQRPDGSELSRLVTRLQQTSGAGGDHRLELALARIDRVRGRLQDAWQRLQPLMAGATSLAELREASQVLLALHAQRGDRELARRALGFALAAYGAGGTAADLLRAWQAAYRTRAKEDLTQLSQRMQAEQAGSAEARLIGALERLDQDLAAVPAAELEGLTADFAEEPIELGLARAIVRIQGGRTADAVRLLDELSQRGPALVDVRHYAAVALLALAQEPGVPAEEVARHLSRARAHLEWLRKNAAADDGRQELWLRLVEQLSPRDR